MTKREHITNIINKYTSGVNKIITGAELATKLGVSIGSINKWKQGKCIPDVELFEPICKVFNISINEFLNMDDTDVVSFEDKELLEKIKSNPALYEYVCKVAK